jgi:hypothetical protein
MLFYAYSSPWVIQRYVHRSHSTAPIETEREGCGRVSRIPGLTPSAAFLLLKHVNKNSRRSRADSVGG